MLHSLELSNFQKCVLLYLILLTLVHLSTFTCTFRINLGGLPLRPEGQPAKSANA